MSENDVGRCLTFQRLIEQRWRKEIQGAVREVTRKEKRVDLDSWIKWYRRLAKGRKVRTEGIRHYFKMR